MNHPSEIPILHFFRTTPANLLEVPPLASSLQSLESTFFLIALERFPSALVSCTNAWESAIKAGLRIQAQNKVTLQKLLDEICERYPSLKQYGPTSLKEFRDKRNEITHYGFFNSDEQVCAKLLAETGLPFLCSLYREFFGFYLDWHDLQPKMTSFRELSEEDKSKTSLAPQVADQFYIVLEMMRQNKLDERFNPAFCFTAFSHYLRIWTRDSQKSDSHSRLIDWAESSGVKSSFQTDEIQRLSRITGDERWIFDCPICNECSCVVAEIDGEALDRNQVSLIQCTCVSCSLHIPSDAYHLADLVFKHEIENNSKEIRNKYGLPEP